MLNILLQRSFRLSLLLCHWHATPRWCPRLRHSVGWLHRVLCCGGVAALQGHSLLLPGRRMLQRCFARCCPHACSTLGGGSAARWLQVVAHGSGG